MGVANPWSGSFRDLNLTTRNCKPNPVFQRVWQVFLAVQKMSRVARPSRGRVEQRQESCTIRISIRNRTSFLVVHRGTGLLCLTAPDRESVGPPGFRMPEILAAHFLICRTILMASSVHVGMIQVGANVSGPSWSDRFLILNVILLPRACVERRVPVNRAG